MQKDVYRLLCIPSHKEIHIEQTRHTERLFRHCECTLKVRARVALQQHR